MPAVAEAEAEGEFQEERRLIGEILIEMGSLEEEQLQQALDLQREQGGLRAEAEEAKSNLVRFREEIRGLVQEKSRMLATLASAQARRRMSDAIEGLSVDADMKALEGVRDHSARVTTEGALEREIGAAGVRTRIRAIRDEVREEAARRELAELKAELRPELAEKSGPPTGLPMPETLAASAG